MRRAGRAERVLRPRGRPIPRQSGWPQVAPLRLACQPAVQAGNLKAGGLSVVTWSGQMRLGPGKWGSLQPCTPGAWLAPPRPHWWLDFSQRAIQAPGGQQICSSHRRTPPPPTPPQPVKSSTHYLVWIVLELISLHHGPADD